MAFSLYFEKKISALLRGLILKSTHTQKKKSTSSVVCWFLTLYKVNALHYKRTLIFQTLVNLVARTRTTVPEYKRTVHEKYFRECEWRNNSSHSSGSLCCKVSLISLRFPGAVTLIWSSVSLFILCYCHLNKVSLRLGFDCLASIHDYKDVQGRHQHWNCILFFIHISQVMVSGGPTSPRIYSSLLNGWTENAVPLFRICTDTGINQCLYVHPKKEGKKNLHHSH